MLTEIDSNDGAKETTTFYLTHWGRDKMTTIFKMTFFKCIFLNENICISIKISLKFVPKLQINNIPALVQIMAWHRPGDKPLSEPMMQIPRMITPAQVKKYSSYSKVWFTLSHDIQVWPWSHLLENLLLGAMAKH